MFKDKEPSDCQKMAYQFVNVVLKLKQILLLDIKIITIMF